MLQVWSLSNLLCFFKSHLSWPVGKGFFIPSLTLNLALTIISKWMRLEKKWKHSMCWWAELSTRVVITAVINIYMSVRRVLNIDEHYVGRRESTARRKTLNSSFSSHFVSKWFYLAEVILRSLFCVIGSFFPILVPWALKLWCLSLAAKLFVRFGFVVITTKLNLELLTAVHIRRKTIKWRKTIFPSYEI